MNTRKARKAATRTALREAALRCFDARVGEDVSIADITREAGVAHGTFYVHFPSKEALLDDLLETFNAGLVERLGPVLADAGTSSLSDLVGRAAAEFLAYWHARRGFVAAFARRTSRGITLLELRDGINPPATALLVTGLRAVAPTLGEDEVLGPLMAQALLAAWLRVGLQHLFNPAVAREHAQQVLVRVTLGVLEGPGEQA